jgi:hypothetical protein
MTSWMKEGEEGLHTIYQLRGKAGGGKWLRGFGVG